MSRALNRHHKTISALFAKFQATGSVHDIQRRPRRRVTTYRQDRQILLSHLRNRKRNARETARGIIGNHQRAISDETVRKRLRDNGVRARRPKVGIILTARHRALRMAWARRHVRFTRAQWANVLFTDESRFTVSGNDGRTRVYRRRGERFANCCITERDRYGRGSVMVWGGVSLHSKTQLVIVNGNLNAAQYQQQILTPHAIPHVQANRGMILVQDNAPVHTARATQQMLQNNNVRTLDWPPCSPDLNPIENVWDELGRRVRALPQQVNVLQLQGDLVQTWNSIPQRFLHNFIDSMRRRCQLVIRARGGHIEY